MRSIFESDMDLMVDFYSEIAATYRWKYSNNVVMQQKFLAPLAPYLNNSSVVIDLCCGSGCMSRGLDSMGIEKYIGVDAAPGMIVRAREEFPDKDFRVARAEDLRAAVPETCSGFTVIHAFSHIPPSIALRIMRGLRSVLRPGARGLVIAGALTTLPQTKVIRTKSDIPRELWGVAGWPGLLAVAWSVDEFRRSFEKSGFKELDIAVERGDADNVPFYFEAI